MPTKTKRVVDVETKVVGGLVNPVLTVTNIPTTPEVGDKITPTIKVEYPSGTPLSGVSVDFFVEDTLGTSEMGTRQTTGASGEATASDGYYVPDVEAENTIKFIIVVQKKSV